MTSFRVGSASDVGRVRSNNQDAKLIAPDLYAVADGMGGHQGGEVASAIAVETLRSAVRAPTVPGLVQAVQEANGAIYSRSAADPDLRGMGTTLCALALVELDDGTEQLMVINVGDSRAYLFHGGDLSQITRDHSLVEDLRAEGRLTAEEAAVHPHRNILTRALGIDPEVDVDHTEIDPVAGDRFLLCSDGLFNEVTVERIAATLRRLVDPSEAASELVRLANDHGGRDNITVVVIDIDDGGHAASASAVAADPDPHTEVAAVVPADLRVPPEDDLAGFSTADKAELADRPGRDADDEGTPDTAAEAHHDVRTRRFTWRVALFVVVVLAVLLAAVGAVGWYARRTYYVGVQSGEVTIFKGQPGGVLWFDPTVAEHTGVPLSEMPAQYRDELTKGHSTSSVGAAHDYIRKLQGVAAAQGVGGSSSTTTTTATTTATTKPAPPTSAPAP